MSTGRSRLGRRRVPAMPSSTELHGHGELLGEIIAPSGILVTVDCGLLFLWRHDGTPVFPDGFLDPETTASVNSGVDFRIDGPDAITAGRLFDRGWHPRYIYDIPASGVLEMQRQ